jgi:hypothetical protein
VASAALGLYPAPQMPMEPTTGSTVVVDIGSAGDPLQLQLLFPK